MEELNIQNLLVAALNAVIEAREEVEGQDDDGVLADIARTLARAGEGLANVETFAELMTRNKGLVIRMDDGSEFQVSIVQSR